MSATIQIEVPELAELQRFYTTAPQRTKAMMTKALQFSAILIQRNAKMEAPVDTGDLRSSINVRYLPDAAIISPSKKYAIYVHEGTGLYGPTHSRIYPRRSKVLAWRSGGSLHFARSVRGIRPNPFMERAANQSRQGVSDVFSAAVQRLIRGES